MFVNAQEIINETERYYLPVFGRYQVVLSHGKGCMLYDVNGKEYVDFLAGIAVNALGHAHPAMVKAISEQAGKLMHCSCMYYTEVQAEAVRLISEVSGFARVFLCNSGAEANEGAIKLALKYGVSKRPGKYKVISANSSFHGRTLNTVAATGQPHYNQGYGPLPAGHDWVDYNDIDALKAKLDDDVCAVILEPIQGEGGVNVPAKGYLAAVRELCDKHDALLIFDEIQTGVGRTGKWFAYMHSGVKPDIITIAKGVGGGFPIGAFAVDERCAHVFAKGDHGGTFGGNPLACAAVCAALSTIKKDGLVENTVAMGKYFKMRLAELAQKYADKVTDIRGEGLLLGMELVKPGTPVVEHCLADGVIINCTAGKVLRFVPPLIVTQKEIDKVIAALDAALTVF